MFDNANVVATIHSRESLAAARKLQPGEADFLELRVDAFASEPEALLVAAPTLPLPLIITVRHPNEGGAAAGLTEKKRRELFEKFLPHATLVDMELRSVEGFAPLIITAHERGLKLILSHHDFQKTPSPARLRALQKKARASGADIFKLAARAATPRDLAILLNFLAVEKTSGAPQLSVMAMGAFGKISRLLFAATGSVLNYGFLHRANASGQWPAKLLKKRIEELTEQEE